MYQFKFFVLMIISFFKFFVEGAYHTTVAYNRAYNKSTKDELSDIKLRQFLLVWAIIGFMVGFSVFCVSRYLVDINVRDYDSEFVVELAIDALLALFVVKRLNNIGMYEEAIAKVENKDKRQLIRYRWRTGLIGCVKLWLYLAVIYGTRWLLITFF